MLLWSALVATPGSTHEPSGLRKKCKYFSNGPLPSWVPWNNAFSPGRANAFWRPAVVDEADSVNSVTASACHIGGPNSVNPGQILLVYGTETFKMV